MPSSIIILKRDIWNEYDFLQIVEEVKLMEKSRKGILQVYIEMCYLMWIQIKGFSCASNYILFNWRNRNNNV